MQLKERVETIPQDRPPSRNTESPIALRYLNKCSDNEDSAARGQHHGNVPWRSFRNPESLQDRHRSASVPRSAAVQRSPSVPRTVRKVKVTVKVTPSPLLTRKTIGVSNGNGENDKTITLNDSKSLNHQAKEQTHTTQYDSSPWCQLNVESSRVPNYEQKQENGNSVSDSMPNHEVKDSKMHDNDINIDDIVMKMTPEQKSKLSEELMRSVSIDMLNDLFVEKISKFSSQDLELFISKIPNQVCNQLLLTLFPKATDDLKLSMILECLPKLSVKNILKDLNDLEKEKRKESLRRMTFSLMSHERKH